MTFCYGYLWYLYCDLSLSASHGTLLSLIESSEFVSQHLLHHHYHHPTSEDDFLITLIREGKAALFPLNGENYKLSDIPHPYKDDARYPELKIPAPTSCNGIICIYQQRKEHCYLWNPARKQCRILPEKKLPEDLSHVLDYFSIQYAIGFDDKTNDYKVVRLVIVHGCCPNSSYAHKINHCQLDIYSLSTDSWSVTEDIVLPVGAVRCIIDSTKAPFHNGKYFCWLGEIALDYNQIQLLPHILSFDFSNEVLGTMPLPESIVFSDNRQTIATLRDKLVCIDFWHDSLGDLFDIWILNEFGVKESWNKLYTIGKFQFLDLGMYNWLRGIPNSRELLFEACYRKIRLCNLITGAHEEMKSIHCPNYFGLLMMFKESLVSI